MTFNSRNYNVVTMAADQRKRRLSASTSFSHSSREPHRAKKKALAVQHHDSNLNSHVSLKWDDNGKKVVAKGAQIGISWRHLSQFMSSVSRVKNILADVFEVPEDVFELNGLEGVVSYEVWQSLLTETERNYLMQFLPSVLEPEQLVETLLSGNNFQFGSPFSRWGTSVCSGDFHPDVVLHHEQSFRANKKAYYLGLQNYHASMVKKLQKMKERCYNSKDPEREIQQLGLRIRRPTREVRSCDPEENVASASESCSWVADEKGGSSDNQNLLAKGNELQKRIYCKDSLKEKTGKASMPPDGIKLLSRPRKGVQKANVNQNDGAKYMSYVMISKKQLDLVKSMRQSGNSIESRALNCVLGDLNNCNVMPYEMFEEEEQKRILDHWSALANKDIPSAYENWRKRRLERLGIASDLWQEMQQLKFPFEDDKEENYYGLQQTPGDGARADRGSILDNNEVSDPSSGESPSPSQTPSLDVNKECSPGDLNVEDDRCQSDDSDASAASSEYNHVTSNTAEELPDMVNYLQTHSKPDVAKAEELPMSDPYARDAWPISKPDPFCLPSSSNMQHGSSHELSLGNQHVVGNHQSASSIGLESGAPEDDTTKDLFQQTDLPFYSAYQNQERNERLQSLVNLDDYNQVQKNRGSEFHPDAGMFEPSQYPGNFRGHLPSPFVLENRGHNDLYMNLQDRSYASNSQYSTPTQDQISPVNMGDWSSTACISASMHPHLSSGQQLNNISWLSGEKRSAAHARRRWSGSEGTSAFSNQSLGGGSSSGDQSFYGVLPQCNTFHSHNPYGTMGAVSAEKFIPTGNFGDDIVGGIPRASNHLTQPAAPVGFLSGHDAAPAARANSTGWVGLPHQAAALPDSNEKPFF